MKPGEAIPHPVFLIALPGKLPRHELRMPAWGSSVSCAMEPTPDGFKTVSYPARMIRTEGWLASVIEVPPESNLWEGARPIRGDISRELPYHLEKD